MRTTPPNRCSCGRPATCPCGRCVLHCHCPTPEELAEQRRQLARAQARVIVAFIERHAAAWDWRGNAGETILWDNRLSHVGHYVAADPDGTLWYNKSYADGRGMTEYNYGSRRLSPGQGDGLDNESIIRDLGQLAQGQPLPDERIRPYTQEANEQHS